ncbi:uncharacterized protein LOC113237035 [Hyposmocoma kahamanoa]|uniref:uncharacterized protein LOC113237035 n=1 Tax=Hyposmocoma kahamanoa TaxID=1477025 RepID=UPI000E6D9436|nr:uncharacterized protein LOC113237035 [Hyposmocoma kahamanoa]
MRVICCADDTLVTARGRTYGEAARLSTVVTSLVEERIHLLGKDRPFWGRLPIPIKAKYLGLLLDGRWNFRTQIAQLAPKLAGTAAALGRLLPNVGGPGSVCRRLYTGIIRSMALYGAPVWVEALTARLKPFLRRPQRVIAVRAIRGYRTVSWTAASLLAGDPPWELQAEVLAEVYRYRAAMQARGERPSAEDLERIRAAGRVALIRKRTDDLEAPVPAQ